MSTLSVHLTCSTNSFNPSLSTFLRQYPCPLVLLSLTIASSFETCIYPLLFADLLFVPYSFPCSNSSFHSSLAALSPHCFYTLSFSSFSLSFFFFTFCFYDVYTVPHYSYDHPFLLWKQLLYFDMDKLIYIAIQPFLRHFPLVCCILLNITLHFTVKLFKHLTLNDTVTQHGHAFDALHA